MNDEAAAPFPSLEPELLAAYLDGTLTPGGAGVAAAYRAGVRWMDLLVAWEAGNLADARAMATRLESLLTPVPLGTPAVALVRLVAQRVADGKTPDEAAESAALGG